MFGLKETIDFFGKSVRLSILFEVVDDPEDRSDYLGHTKPLDVWLFASDRTLTKEQASLASIQKEGRCIRNITKATPPELRKYAFPAFEDGFLYVFAVPTTEWQALYAHRQYAPLPIKSGNTYNFAVSLPEKPSTRGIRGAADPKDPKSNSD